MGNTLERFKCTSQLNVFKIQAISSFQVQCRASHFQWIYAAVPTMQTGTGLLDCVICK